MEFSRNSKRMAMEDMLTNLPSGVLHCILDNLPVRDAARTSILSRRWRYIWASHPNLELDPYTMAVPNNNDFVGIVNGILLQHTGPILYFRANISKVNVTQYPNVDRWILYLSRNGVKKLVLANISSDVYTLPSYVFLCAELNHLQLYMCAFNPPCGTTGSFRNLQTLHLIRVVFTPEISAPLFAASRLQSLSLGYCRGINHLNFDGCSTSLDSLVLVLNYGVKLRCFMNCHSITFARLTSPVQIVSYGFGERINLTDLFQNWPLLSEIKVDGHYLKFLAAGSVPRVLPVTPSHLREITFSEIDFNDLQQISCILCLLHSSPAVRSVEICVKEVAVTAHNNLVSQYLQHRSCMNESINSMQTVTIKHFQGSRAEILFVQHILACCTSLEMITFLENRLGASEVVINILRDLLLMHRASTKASIVF